MTTQGRAPIGRFMAIFAGGTLFSRVLGLARDAALGAFVPPATRDAFLLAFQLPNMLRDMLGEGAANAALIPVFSKRLEQSGEEAYKESVRAVLGVFVALFGVLTVAGVLLVPYVPQGVALLQRWSGGEGPPPEQWANTVAVMQWMFPYLFFIGLTAFATAPLFIARHYFTPSWSPALLNLALIACAMAPAVWFGGEDWGLVAAVWIGGVAQMGVMFYMMSRKVGVWRPSLNFKHPDVWMVFALLVPVIIGQSAGEINKLVDRFFAYGLEADTVTALYFSNRLIQLPLALFGVGVSVAILPEMSRALARNDLPHARETLVIGLRQSFYLLAPAAAGLMVLGAPMVRVLFERGQFSPETTLMTVTAMQYSAAGLLAFGWIKVTAQGFFAAHDSRTPVAAAAISMVCNIVLSFALVPSMGYRGLALASTLSYMLNFLILFVLLSRRYGALFDRPALLDGAKVLLATALAVGAGWGLMTMAGETVAGNWAEAGVLAVALALFCAVYGGASVALRVPEAQQLWRAVRRRVK